MSRLCRRRDSEGLGCLLRGRGARARPPRRRIRLSASSPPKGAGGGARGGCSESAAASVPWDRATRWEDKAT